MASNSHIYQINKIDLRILQVLDWSGRMSVKRIARHLHKSKDVIAYRIKRLEREGIIAGYYPVFDMFKLGYFTSRIYFEIEEMTQKEEEDVVHFLDKEIGAGMIFRMDYPYRYGVFLWTASVYEIEKAIEKIKRKLGRRLSRYNYSLICTLRQYPKDYLFEKDEHSHMLSMEPCEQIPYDTKDFKILRRLAEEGRASTVEIAKAAQLPQTTVSHKIKRLQKEGIILGYRAQISFERLGYVNYFLEIYLDEHKELTSIEAWASVNPNVMWLQKIIGTCDIEIEVEVKDRKALEQLLGELRQRFKTIRKIIFWSQEYKKLTFLP